VLHPKNIEAVCSSEAEVCEQIRLTVIHELGHYFGMDENQLKAGWLKKAGLDSRVTIGNKSITGINFPEPLES
jgi:hypothetical protein